MSPVELGLNEKAELLRQAVQDLSANDEKLNNHVHLYHWLRGNKFDVKKAEKAIRKNAKWREEKGIDKLADQPLDPKLEAKVPYFFDQTGTGGVPVAYFHTGYVELAALIDEFGKDRVLLHMAQCLAKKERIVYEFDKTWKGTVQDLPPERAIGLYGIYDAHAYSLKNNASFKVLGAFGDWAKMVLNYFPAAGHVICTTNAPKSMDIPLSVMKPIIGDRFDFTVHGEQEEDWKVVASHVTKEQLEGFKKRAEALKAAWQ